MSETINQQLNTISSSQFDTMSSSADVPPQVVSINSPDTNDNPFDNANTQYCSSGQAPDDSSFSILERIINLLPFIGSKLSQSYLARSILMFIIPLTLGVMIGYYVARNTRKKEEKVTHRKDEQLAPLVSFEKRPSLLRRASSSCRGIIQDWIWCGQSTFNSNVATIPAATSTTASINNEPLFAKVDSFSSEESDASSQATPVTVEDEIMVEKVLSGRKIVLDESKNGDLPVFPDSNGKHFNRLTLKQREEQARAELENEQDFKFESGVPLENIPRHVAVIMDGNRRYGKSHYNHATSGHWEGGRKLLQFAKWCVAEKIPILTVYAFSTENWNRDPAEVAALMKIFVKYCNALREEAVERNIRVRIISTEKHHIPHHVKKSLRRLEKETKDCRGGLQLNICLSYGSRGEIVNACRALAKQCVAGKISPKSITEDTFGNALTLPTTSKPLDNIDEVCPDPDVLIRTSGEMRLSNFLLWQLAYTEFFFIEKTWPELEKEDLLKIIRTFAGRKRRFGK